MRIAINLSSGGFDFSSDAEPFRHYELVSQEYYSSRICGMISLDQINLRGFTLPSSAKTAARRLPKMVVAGAEASDS
jgi:hypothetical protein